MDSWRIARRLVSRAPAGVRIVARKRNPIDGEPTTKRSASEPSPPPDDDDAPRQKRVRRYGPASRIVTRGAIGDMDGNSWEAKFIKANEAKYIEQTGGDPDHALRRLIIRLVRLELRMELFEQKPHDQWTDHDGRTFGGLNSAFRLLNREFRQLARKQAKDPSLAEYMAARDREKVAAA